MDNETATSSISAEERKRRQAAISYARASSRLEGVLPSPELAELNARYVSGELSREQLNAAVLEHFGKTP